MEAVGDAAMARLDLTDAGERPGLRGRLVPALEAAICSDAPAISAPLHIGQAEAAQLLSPGTPNRAGSRAGSMAGLPPSTRSATRRAEAGPVEIPHDPCPEHT